MDAVVVSFNSEDDLSGLFGCGPLVDAFDRIIVVDNASGDRSRDVAHRAGADVVAGATNEGFGAAANAGAARTSGPAFFLLNPDIRFDSSTVPERLVDNFTDSSVAIAAPRLVLPDGTFQGSARAIPTPWAIVRRRWADSSFGAIQCDERCDVPWVVGACMLVRRSTFDAVGGFDPSYFMYFEDVDLCVRLGRRGWRVRFDPAVEVAHHHAAASRAGVHSPATRAHMRSAARFFRRHPRLMTAHRREPQPTRS